LHTPLRRSIDIRPATAADAAIIAAIYLTARRRFLPYAPIVHPDADVRQWIASVMIPAGGVYVAVVADTVVGMLALSDDGAVRWIDQLYLHPDAVNQGIGTALLQHALTLLTPPVHLYTFQANTGARRFYERFGFRPIAYGDGSANEEGCPDVLYAWDGTDTMSHAKP
jgi:GNAT superfamily N-acetyltransferase